MDEETGGLPSQQSDLQRVGEHGTNRVFRFLRNHPILVLALLSPGIPEYMSGSSDMAVLALNPVAFLLFLGLNMGLYSTGVLLVREAVVRWKKGWASVLLLGFAYAILEEGLALQTLFNPLAQPVGNLGVYGRWLGVNWVWTVGLLLFHSAYSIALPIFLFGMAFPKLKSKSLLSNRATAACLTILSADSMLLYTIVRYWPGWELILLSTGSIALLVFGARRISADLLTVSHGLPYRRPLVTGAFAGLFFPAALLTGAVAAGANVHPFIPIVLDIVFSFVILRAVLRSLGSHSNQTHKLGVVIGLAVPVVCFGIIARITIPLVALADLAFAIFISRLWKRVHLSSIGPSLGTALGTVPGHA
jgi:hypothetical protein